MLRSSATASRDMSSTPRMASAASSGFVSIARRAAAVCTPISEMWWATESCRSRAMRRRSAITAWSASCRAWAWTSSRLVASSSAALACSQAWRPSQIATPKYARFITTVPT